MRIALLLLTRGSQQLRRGNCKPYAGAHLMNRATNVRLALKNSPNPRLFGAVPKKITLRFCAAGAAARKKQLAAAVV
jgi:hypothetical protein